VAIQRHDGCNSIGCRAAGGCAGAKDRRGTDLEEAPLDHHHRPLGECHRHALQLACHRRPVIDGIFPWAGHSACRMYEEPGGSLVGRLTLLFTKPQPGRSAGSVPPYAARRWRNALGPAPRSYRPREREPIERAVKTGMTAGWSVPVPWIWGWTSQPVSGWCRSAPPNLARLLQRAGRLQRHSPGKPQVLFNGHQRPGAAELERPADGGWTPGLVETAPPVAPSKCLLRTSPAGPVVRVSSPTRTEGVRSAWGSFSIAPILDVTVVVPMRFLVAGRRVPSGLARGNDASSHAELDRIQPLILRDSPPTSPRAGWSGQVDTTWSCHYERLYWPPLIGRYKVGATALAGPCHFVTSGTNHGPESSVTGESGRRATPASGHVKICAPASTGGMLFPFAGRQLEFVAPA